MTHFVLNILLETCCFETYIPNARAPMPRVPGNYRPFQHFYAKTRDFLGFIASLPEEEFKTPRIEMHFLPREISLPRSKQLDYGWLLKICFVLAFSCTSQIMRRRVCVFTGMLIIAVDITACKLLARISCYKHYHLYTRF